MGSGQVEDILLPRQHDLLQLTSRGSSPSTDRGSPVENVVYIIAYAIGASLNFLLTFVPTWLVLGGLVYVVARLLGKKLTFFRAVFDWWVTLAVVIPILLVGWPSP
jgi:hypothetical protein